MHQPNRPERPDTNEQIRASLSMLGFGLLLLAFLIAIERPQWFVLRPALGTAAALSKAAIAPSPADDGAYRATNPSRAAP